MLKKVLEKWRRNKIAERVDGYSNHIYEELRVYTKIDHKYRDMIADAAYRIKRIKGRRWRKYNYGDVSFWVTNASAKVVKIDDGKYYPAFVDGVCKMAEKSGDTAIQLAYKSAKILEKGGEYMYKTVVDLFYKPDRERVKGWSFMLEYAASHLRNPIILGTVNKMLDKNPNGAFFIFTQGDEILGKMKHGSTPSNGSELLEIFGELGRVDEHYAYGLIKRTNDISYSLWWKSKRGEAKYIDFDDFLIHAIRDQKDAQVISHVVSIPKLIGSIRDQKDAQIIGPSISEEYIDLYNEKVAAFY